MTLQDERLEDFRAWALARIRHCQEQEVKLEPEAWRYPGGVHLELVERRGERRALETSLNFLFPGFLERHEEYMATHTKGDGSRG